MSAQKYQYGHKLGKKRPRKAITIFFFSTVVIAIIGGVVYLDLNKNTGGKAEGERRIVSQVLSDNAQVLTVNEPTFSMDLPNDWKETGRNGSSRYNSISYQATRKGKDNRYLTVYGDRLPPNRPFNPLVVVKGQGTGHSSAVFSENCANFTIGGTFDSKIAVTLKPTITKWNKVDFYCNLPRVADNEVGIGSEGSPNAVAVTGPLKGEHKYFFVYADRNYQPDYEIFYDILGSFKAK